MNVIPMNQEQEPEGLDGNSDKKNQKKTWEETPPSSHEDAMVVGKCRWCLTAVDKYGNPILPYQYQMKAGIFAKLPLGVCKNKTCQEREKQLQETWKKFQEIKPFNNETII